MFVWVHLGLGKHLFLGGLGLSEAWFGVYLKLVKSPITLELGII